MATGLKAVFQLLAEIAIQRSHVGVCTYDKRVSAENSVRFCRLADFTVRRLNVPLALGMIISNSFLAILKPYVACF